MADEPFRARIKHLDPNHDKYKRSKKHEDRIGKRLGGKRLPRSGGLSVSKWSTSKALKTNPTLDADISAPSLAIEHKRTDNESIGLKKEWLLKVKEGARRMGKDPAVILTFEKKGSPLEEWAVIPLEVLERYRKLEGLTDG